MSNQLSEISLLRPITICLLVVMHGFTMYAGCWPLPEGIQPVRAYFWVQKITYGSMLEMFVFISGYLFSYQLFGQKREYTLGRLVISKFRRLIIPSMFFSLLYVLCFSDLVTQHRWLSIAHVVIAGYKHMWFLPMLFWCFIGGWALYKSKINDLAVLCILIVLSFFSHFQFDFQLPHTCYYLFFFYLGMVMYKHREFMKDIAANNAIGIYFAFVTYIILIILHTRTIEIVAAQNVREGFDKLMLWAQHNACMISYALNGVVVIYLLALRYVSMRKLSPFTIKVNSYCFGIYIAQSFIYMVIYYKLSLPQIVGTYWLPWAGSVISLVLSYLLTRLFLYTRIGKFLLG